MTKRHLEEREEELIRRIVESDSDDDVLEELAFVQMWMMHLRWSWSSNAKGTE